jgi:hypothetical protein
MKIFYFVDCAYSSILRRFSLLNSGMSDTDGGRNISVDEGAVCDLRNEFFETLNLLVLFIDVDFCAVDSPN